MPNRLQPYFSGQTHQIFDDFPHDYYAQPMRHETSSRSKAQVTMAFDVLGAMLGGNKGVYLACAISSGMRGAMIVEQVKEKFIEAGIRPTTVKLAEFAGSSYVSDQIFKPNTDQNMAYIAPAQQLFPDKLVIAPAGLEAFVHVTARQPAFSRGQRWEEDDYRAWWFPVIDLHINTLIINRDLNFSRVGTEEIMRCTLIQAGLSPARPKADMAVVDKNGANVSLADRAETIADYLRWAAPRGHDVVIAATALTRLCYLSDQIEAARSGEDSVITYQKLNKVLKKRPREDVEKIAAIKASMGPFLAHYCPDQINQAQMPQTWLNDFLAGVPTITMATKLDEMKPFVAKQNAQIIPFSRLTSAADHGRLYLQDGDYFGQTRQSDLFEDDLYHRATTERERVILSFVMAAAETALPPASTSQMVFVVADAKTGPAAMGHSSGPDVSNLAELPGTLGQDFARIEKKNRQITTQMARDLRLQNSDRLVITSFDLRSMVDAVASVPQAVVAPGPDRLGPSARTALRHSLIDRNVNRMVLMPGWQASPDNVQDVVRATLIQLGVVPRSPGHQYDMVIYNHHGHEMTLADRIKSLADFVIPALQKDVAVPEQALGLARLLQIHDWLVDPSYRRQAPVELNVQAMDPSLTGITHDKDQQQLVQIIRPIARPLLLAAARHWQPDRVAQLDRDYFEAIPRSDAVKEWQSTRRSGAEIRYKPNRPS